MRTAGAHAVVIGASAGALEALSSILPHLDATFRLAVIVVVHVPPSRRSLLSELFSASCALPVEEAEDKQPIAAGTIYFAPPDYHLLVERDLSLALSSDDPVLFSRPSIDVLFETAAEAYGAGLTGIVLTGANHDGARGLSHVAAAGGTALVQEPDGAFASEMPRAAIRACPDATILSLEGILNYLRKVGSV
jgi:two-component system chemotaxis response regulator CheB